MIMINNYLMLHKYYRMIKLPLHSYFSIEISFGFSIKCECTNDEDMI